MSTTQRKTIVPLPLSTRRCTASAQWLLELPESGDPPKYQKNNLELFICGEEAFAQIAADLKRARSSVEIICWGFDPAMELTRSKSTWPRGDTWGGLLKDVAEGKHNGGKPVQVRLLSWYGVIGNFFTNNMPGYRSGSDYEMKNAVSRGMSAAVYPGGRDKMQPLPPPTDPKDQRELFNAQWYRDVCGGRLKNIALRTRDGDSKAVRDSLKDELGKRGFVESAGMEQVATDHQKTILIDYEHEGGSAAVGYVMGLNSVTDYWDTPEHLFHDPRRGQWWEGDGKREHASLKPYQDYACRIVGESLVAVSKNFTDAWNRAKGNGEKLARTHDLKNPPAGLSRNLKGPPQQAQIVRTQPEEKEKTIQRLYRQATSFARQYLYIENQYFQYTEWATQLKACRAGHVKGWQAAGKSLADLPNLHVMVVIPTPERAGMVPRTYDTVTTLGHGTSVPNQDKLIEDELKKHAEWEAYATTMRAKGQAPSPYKYPGPLSPLAQSAKSLGSKDNIAKELNAMGLRTLVGSLWTYDPAWRTRQRKDIEQAEEWEGVPHAKQRHKAMVDKLKSDRYREIYIHSKLMIIDDSMFTLGSANLNLRSMAVDAEMNVASDDPKCSEDLRRRVWGLHTGGADRCNPASLEPKLVADAFNRWQQLMKNNEAAMDRSEPLTGFLVPFLDERTSTTRLG